MANTLTGLIPTIYESLDVVSREFVGFIPSMQRDNGNFAHAAKGQVVAVPVVPSVTAADITPGVTAPNDGDQVIGSVNLGITKSRYVPIRWNGEEQLGLNNGGPGVAPILVNQLAQGFRALVNEVEADSAAAAVKYASRATGTPGVTPFGTNGSLLDIANTARILDENGAPMIDRHLVLNSPTMANIRGVQGALYKVNEAGDNGDMLRRGSIGALEGFALHYSPGIKQVVKGTGTGYVTTTANPIGTTLIALGTGTGTVNAGDIITFAGDTNQYCVVSGTTGPGTIQIGVPGLRVAQPSSGVAVTINGSYTPNVAFTRDALVLATRLPAVPEFAGVQSDMADDRQTVVDPFSGIAFEVALYRQYRQIKIEIGLAWGVGAIKSDHIAILEA